MLNCYDKNEGFVFDTFTITKREIIASISLFCILLLIGISISSKISESIIEKNEVYNKALKITDSYSFKYGMETNIGDAFVYGDLEAVDTVSYKEDGIDGEYMYVKKVKERYTMHTREVAHTRTVNGKTETYYTTETYYSWDYAGSESKTCEKVTFCGVEFDSGKFSIPSANYICKQKVSHSIRYKYYGTNIKHTGTIFTVLKDNTIPDKTKLYNNNIDELIEYFENDCSLVIFWIFWIILMFGSIVVFYVFENKWLE